MVTLAVRWLIRNKEKAKSLSLSYTCGTGDRSE
jgi:hypothetical protein